MPLPKIHIPIDKEIREFRAYLDSTDRAMLSAKFGDGKSTFLDEFAKKNQKYAVIKINPLHYQVADNKDIFEYIKRDILLQQLSYIELEEVTYSNVLLICYYLKNSGLEILDDIIDSIPNIDLKVISTNAVKNPLRNLIKNIKNFQKYKENIHDETVAKVFEKFISSFDNYRGSIYEFDLVSQLICDINKQIKKKTILLVEDLDRIDPGHIFRILNILSAHIERNQQGLSELSATNRANKFLFDKVLLVCDFDNIRSVFHHLYGEKTDFKGYISKFSSHKPFRFSLKNKYKSFILDKLDKQLRKYEEVADIIASLIAENELERTILRDLDNLLTNKYPTIQRVTIPIDIDNGENQIEIPVINDLTKLLDLLNRFSIPFDSLYHKCIESKNENVLYKLVGVCWLIPVQSQIHLDYHSKNKKVYVINNKSGNQPFVDAKIT